MESRISASAINSGKGQKTLTVLIYAFFMLIGPACADYPFENPVDPGTGKPLAPVLQSVQLTSDTSAQFGWTDANDYSRVTPAAAAYEIEWSENGQTFQTLSKITRTPGLLSQTIPSTFRAGVDYAFRMRVVLGGGNPSPESNTLGRSITFLPPTSLILVYITENATRLSWTYSGLYATHFEIEQSADGGSSYSQVMIVPRDSLAVTLMGTFLSPVDYRFRVRAISKVNQSQYVSTATARMDFPAPTELSVVSISETVAALQWQITNAQATRTVIERSSDGLTFVPVDSVVIGTTSALVNGPYLADVTYSFRVRARSIINVSAYSNTAAQSFAFPPPVSLMINSLAEGMAQLSWTNENGQAKSIVFERSVEGGAFSPIDSVPASVTSLGIPGPYVADKLYSFRARSKSNVNISGPSNIASSSYEFLSPTNVQVLSFVETSLRLGWQHNKSGITAFEVEESRDAGSTFALVTLVAKDSTAVSLGNKYYTTDVYQFRVRALSAVNRSTYAVSEITHLSFPAPQNPAVVLLTESIVQLQWMNINLQANRILIEKSTDGSSFALVDSVPETATSAALPGSYHADTVYYFRLRSKSDLNTSIPSNVVSSSFGFPAPTNVQLASFLESGVRLTWDHSRAGVTGFEVEMSRDGGITFTPVKLVPRDSLGVTIDGPYYTRDTYQFRVRAVSTINRSAYATTGNATLPFPAPTGLTVILMTESFVQLQWTNTNPQANRILIEISPDGTAYAVADSVLLPAAAAALNGPFQRGWTYHFRARSRSALNTSVPSNVASYALP